MSTIKAVHDNARPASPEGKTPSVVPPGSTIGILGGGQLGRMSAMAAKSMGYRVAVYDPTPDGPAFSCADAVFCNLFDDREALGRFAGAVDVVTVEFENIPVSALEFLESRVPVRPSSSVVRICQNRVLEKEFLQGNGFPVAPFRVITTAQELASGLAQLDAPCILKTAVLGYDGKGQVSLGPGDDTEAAWRSLSVPRAVLERRIEFTSEASVICARSSGGETGCFPVQANIHRHGILDVTAVPAGLAPGTEARAMELTSAIAASIGAVGLLTAEFFVMGNGDLVVNELAPRPHNSGHHTIETTLTSQFAQHVRAVCGLPLGSVELRCPGVMVNLLGDLWLEGDPDWSPLHKEPGLFLHLYGKRSAKAGRKMGHFTLLRNDRPDLAETVQRAVTLRSALKPSHPGTKNL
jgi:5-(carboxyamino)imidazole ribonucleotide synthase